MWKNKDNNLTPICCRKHAFLNDLQRGKQLHPNQIQHSSQTLNNMITFPEVEFNFFAEFL